jgi:RNA exonuclease 1
LTPLESAREYLGQFIQNGGGTTGHSSVEDARATLDLVRWWVMDKEKKKDSKL